MTKNKIPKMAAAAQTEVAEQQPPPTHFIEQQPLPTDFDPLTLLNDTLDAATAAYNPPIINEYTNPLTDHTLTVNESDHICPTSFQAGPDPDGVLADMLITFNNSIAPSNGTVNPLMALHAANGTSVPPCNIPDITFGQDVNLITEEQWTGIMAEYDGPQDVGSTMQGAYFKGWAIGPDPNFPAQVPNPMVEVERQSRLVAESNSMIDTPGFDFSDLQPAEYDDVPVWSSVESEFDFGAYVDYED